MYSTYISEAKKKEKENILITKLSLDLRIQRQKGCTSLGLRKKETKFKNVP